MKNTPYRKTLVMILVFTLVMTNLMSALAFAAPPGNGEFKITDQPGTLVEANHFDEKDDVYIYSDGNMTDGEYYVKVTGPNGNDLLGDTLPNTITITSGNFGPINLWAITGGYDDTPNSGGIYKIHMSPNDEFPNSDTFTKTFTVEVLLGQIQVIKDVPELNDATVFEFNLINDQQEEFGPFSFSEEESAMIELPYGTYTVTEVPHEGYTTTTDSYSNIVVNESSSPRITFQNIPITTEGTLKVYKDVPNVEEDPTEFEFNIFIPGDSDPFLVLNGGELEYAVTQLPEGFYHISETPMEGYTTTTPGYRNIEVVAGEVTDVYFENTLDNTVGGLQIYKDVPNVEEDPTVFEFNIFIPGESDPFLVLDGGEISNAYTRLPEGFYHISETPMEGYTTTTPGYRNIEIVAGEITDVYFENTLDNTVGGLQIYKDVPNVDEDPTEFEFNIFIPGESEPFLVLDGSEISNAYTRLPEGFYHISETPMEGYTTTTPGYRNIEVVAGEVTDVYFENILDNTVGGLQIYKDVPNVAEDSTVFEFNIFIPGESDPFLVLDGSEISNAYTRLPEGFYHISETPMEGYTTTTPGYRNIEVVAGEVTDVYFENILDNTVGGLQIYKDVPNVEEDPTVFEFNIFIPGESDPFLVLDGSEISNAYTRLPEGFYHISETPMEGYTTTTPGYRNIEVVAGEVTDVYFENTLDNTVGGLQIYKDVPNVEEDPTVFEFNIFIPGESDPFLVLNGSEISNAYTRLPEGFYHISEAPMEGYTTTTPGYRNIEIVAGVVTDVYFENTLDDTFGELKIYKEVPNVTNDSTVFDFNIYQFSEQEPVLIDTVQASEINSGMITLLSGFYMVTEVSNENYINDNSEFMVEVSFTTSPSVTFYNYSLDASLGIVKTVDDSSITTGQDANYTVVVTNTGSTLLENILVTDVFDDEDPTIIDENLTLDAGQSKTYNYTVEDISTGTHINVATAEIIESEIDPVSDDARVTASRRRDPPSTYSVSGYVFEDFNSDNLINNEDFGYEGIVVELFDDDGDLIDTDVTDSNGRYSFSDLRGSYKIEINLNESQVSEYDGLLDQTVELDINENTSQVNFGFSGPVPLALPTIIAGTVFNDINEDNMVDAGEIGYSNVEVTLWAGTTPVLTKMTDANGQYVFNFLTDPELADLEPGDYIVSIGQVPVGVTEVSEYDATLNLMVQLVLEEDTEAIVDVNFGFKTNVVPSGEEANVAMILIGLIILSSGIILRKKSFNA